MLLTIDRKNITALFPIIATIMFAFVAFADQSNSNSLPDNVMKCDPQEVGPGQSIEVSFPYPHGTDFAIVNPAGDYFFMSFTPSDNKSKVEPMIKPDEFAKIRQMSIDVAAVKGIPWSGESMQPSPIFVDSGTYTLLVSSSLETEEPVLDGWCKVQYRASASK